MIYTIYKIVLFIFIIFNRDVMSFTQPLKSDKQCVISIKDNRVYCNSKVKNFIDTSDFLSNKKLITISPGGFKGFYLLGILSYIKETYNLDDFIYDSDWSKGGNNKFFEHSCFDCDFYV